jgi:endonuclease-3
VARGGGSKRTRAARLERAQQVGALLAEALPEPRCELDFANPFQLLVATILSAQTTDKGVNRVTPELFRRYPTPRALADAAQEDVENLIRSTGYYRQKSRHIREAARIIAEEHGGEVPRSMEALTRLPGVARKTANVVLGTAFGIPSGIAVDTHVARVSRRLGLTRGRTPVEIEQDLMALFPQREWTALGHRLVLHGRYTCTARAPRCSACPLRAPCAAPEARKARA